MRVNQVELFEPRHFHHLARQRHRVERKLEERIGGHLDLMIENVVEIMFFRRANAGEPHRQRVGNKMDLMSALGERLSQFGRDHARAAIRGITGDSDVHSM